MKSLNSKIAAARKVYETYWESYSKGDLETFASTLDDKYEMIGTSETEVCHSRADGIAFFKAQMHEVVGKTEMRNRQIDILPVENLMLINEQCDIYVLVDLDLTPDRQAWNFYSKIRISTWLKETETGWKVTQQHGSLPDMRVQEGETLAIEKISKENLELRDAVKRRTAELENKNQELAIEAGLEKVRAVAMGMKKPEDMLEVCRVISDQLQIFGVEKIRNVQIAIIDENIGQYLCFQYFTSYDKTAVEITEYLKSPVEHGMVRQMLASRDGYFIGRLSGKELEDFRIHRKEENHFPDPFLDKATELDYCFLSIGEGGLGLTLYQPMAEDVLTLFKRFHQVFSLAYQRFRDIQKAEAQAREAQMQLALERVRARTMAMQKSEELAEVSYLLNKQVVELGIPTRGCAFNIYNEHDSTEWFSNLEGTLPAYQTPRENIFLKYYEAGQRGELLLIEEFSGERIKELYKFFASRNDSGNETINNHIAEAPDYQINHLAYFKYGYLLFITLVPAPEAHDVFKRFAKEFEQTYTRFLDLQKSEAHARESEIDLALERVRAQTMAMHSSEDVGKCVVKMFSELTALGVDEGTRFGIGILNHDNENNQLWTARKNGDEVNMHIGNIDMASHPLLKSARKAWKEQVSFHRYVLEGKDLLDYYQMLNNAPDYKIQIPIEKLPEREIQHCFIFEHGFFYAFSPREFQPELIQITKRFSSLFEQTYRRYLDLVRAESQAREAEIELALERVRARTMAMHHTEELKEVIQVVFDQFVGLNIHVDHAGFILDYKEREDMHIWLADHQQGVPSEITIPYFDSPHWNSYLEAKAKEESFFANLLPFEVKNKFYRDLFERIPELTEEAQQAIFSKPALAISTVLLDNVGLYIEHYSMTPYTAEENAILMRFGKVFQQTYTRFLDLQKAETQAREAKIENALEKVRSRTMAMQHSEELAETSTEMFRQMQALGMRPWACGFNIFEKDEKAVTQWMSGGDGSLLTPFTTPLTEDPFFIRIYEARQRREELFVMESSGHELEETYKYMFGLPAAKKALGDILAIGFEMPKFQISHCAFFSQGYLMFITYEPYPEAHDIFRRFAKVFEQTYTRFLDLQKAEAQAREARIEAALERVRSRSMAMHKTDELQEVVRVVAEELKHTGVILDTWGAVICTYFQDSKDVLHWTASEDPANPSIAFLLPYFEDELFNEAWESKERGDSYFAKVFSFEVKNAFFNHAFEHSDYRQLPDDYKKLILESENHGIAWAWAKNSAIMIPSIQGDLPSEDEKEILIRFAKVFEQSFIRFLDLQKAEAQARESQIQLAMERVRARTMAMQHSSELGETSALLFQQIQTLGVPPWACGFNIWEQGDAVFTSYMGSPDGAILGGVKIPLTEEATFIHFQESRDRGDKLFVDVLEGETLEAHYRYFLTLPGIKEAFEKRAQAGEHRPTFQINHLANFSHGNLMFITYEPCPEAHDIFIRFAQVFEQTYTRFLDLQKAEAQAREAQIEAALERVRSRSMAMHKSEELAEVSLILFEQVEKLGIRTWSTGFNVWLEDETSYIDWVVNSASGKFLEPYKVDLTAHPSFMEISSAKKQGEDFFVHETEGETLEELYRLLSQMAKTQFEDIVKAGFQLPEHQINHYVFGSKVSLMFITFDPCPDAHDIFKRFGKVFEQTYTRFLDLQRAEAQARESQIQLALERVRARTMAMQHSDELMETSELMFEQIKNLGIELWSCGFSLWYDDDSYFLGYNPGPHGKLGNPLKIPLTEDIFFTTIRDAKRRGDDFLVFESEGESLVETYRYMDGLPVVGETMRGFVEAGFPLPTFQVTHCGFFSNGHLMFITKEPNSEAVDIFRRFTKVFNQTYTRFLDLQKAEEQVREAQIEAALERVRSRSLAMHKTAELQSVIHTVHQELLNLNISISGGSFIVINSEIDTELQCWGSGGTADTSDKVHIPRFEKPFYTHLLNRIKIGPGFFTEEYTREEKIEFFTFLFQHEPWSKLGEKEKKETLSAPGGYTRSCAVSKHTSIFIINHSGEKFSESENAILKRFGKVFEQAYTRFLDLQKAEAQAREAQIEASLERVRSRTMAMQISSELGNVAAELFAQMNQLVTNLWTCGFVLCEKDRDEDEWWLSMDGDFTRGFFLPNVGDYAHATLYEGWQKGEGLRAVQLDGETLQQHYDWLMEIPVSRTIFEEMDAAGLARPDWQKLHAAYFSKGYLVLITREPCGEEEIFKRFAQVFDQTYTRFLDLQKAEAQAREAQVNLAVERVRARALAMFKSEEILQVVHKLKDEIMGLDIPNVAAATIHLKEPDGKSRVWDLTSLEIEDDGLHLPLDIRFRLEDTHPGFFMRRVWENEADYFVVLQEKADFKHTLQWLRDNGLNEQANEADAFFKSTQLKRVYHPTVPLNNGRMCLDLLDSPTPEVASILTKMAGAFDLAYKRFEDLQKAETQAKEAQIELSLERIRSQVTAMQESSDLLEIVVTIRAEFVKLGHEAHYFWHMRWLPERYDKAMTSGDGTKIGMVMTLPRHIHGDIPLVADWEKTKEPAVVLAMDVEMAVDYIQKMITLGDFEQVDPQSPTLDDIRHIGGLTFVMARTTHGEIGYSLPGVMPDPPKDAVDTLVRFAGVFDLAYKRFEDLKSAERQHREAQIQLALERVRARSLAMHRSEELADLSMELVKRVQTLGMESWFCAFNIYDDDPRGSVEWGSNGQGTFPQYRTPREGVFLRYFEAGQRGETFLVNEIGEEACPAHYEYLCSLPGVGEQLLQMKAAGIPFPTSQIDHVAFFKYGYVLFITYEPAPESHDIFKRFAKVFEQSYTRFLDLQKAEAQTREAKIEGALEKVRSRTMGMQSSEELPEVANLLFTEVRALGIHAWSCGYNILAEDKKSATCCMSSEGTLQTPFQLRLWGEASFDEMGEFVLSDHTILVQELGGKALEEHYAYMKSFPDLKPTFDEIDRLGLSLPTYQINHLCKFTQGFILFITYEKVPESHAIFKRFTNVFDQTYTRFLDLKKAEAQAREAQIENALEKVRSRSLAMQSPDELIEVAQLLREEMGALGVEELETSSIYIHDESSGLTQCWFTIKNRDNPDKAITDQMIIDLQDTWVGRKMDEFYKSKAKQTTILMQGKKRIEWIRYCEEKSDLFGTSNFYGETIPDRTYHLYKFSNGYIGAAAPGEISTESWELLKRATAVFSFAYTRFRDLQMAEASARAAVRQASLDRVRAEISSMRHVDDLDRITPLFFQELTTLGIPFIRCGVFIIQEKQEIVEAYLSSPDGNSLGVLRLPFQASELTYQTVVAWRKGAVYRQHWNKEDFIQWINQLMEQDQIQDSSTYQGTAAPPESLDLHFVPFTQGMLYVGSENPLDEKELELVQALAKAFSIAYARYEDFVKLEHAKVEIESAMIELKATQSQLVQQEKLASLGQLTAGIAHEIKNPLNFVNNFSEVSIELVDEAIEERSKGPEARDESLVDEILIDIKSNLKKVHEHGSRANGIVTSMLQHSRGGSGKMEPTDLNALIKEYVNLSFHGMRAGKSPINVDIQLDLDQGIKEVSLIKEDFTRVIINLCNNAFDAMRGKKYQVSGIKYQDEEGNDIEYLPKLNVTTSLEKGQVRIAIQDNGPGIPDDIKDKILQPFFTTKKGTEGTGLGLSITHDIVKAHGGELKVETKAGVGTTFIIELEKKQGHGF